jgi:hypothetical protein
MTLLTAAGAPAAVILHDFIPNILAKKWKYPVAFWKDVEYNYPAK